jgi:hypothetical protein
MNLRWPIVAGYAIRGLKWLIIWPHQGGDFLAKHKKVERVREIERRRHRREKRKKLAAKALKEAAAGPATA